MEGSNEQSRNHDLQDSRSGPWSALFGALGGLAIAGGGVLAFGAQIGPDMGWIARSLGRIGIDSGVALGCGVLSLGVSVVFRQLHRMNAKLAAAEESVERTEFLSLAMRQLSETMNVIHSEMCELKDRQIATLQVAQEGQQNGELSESVGMQVDATFRLASSVDQLGASFETRINQHTQSMLESMQNLSQTLSAKQDEVCHMIEESAHEIDDRLSQFKTDPLDVEPRMSPAETEIFGEFEGDVELDGWEEIAESKVNVASYDWDSVQIPEAHRKTDLGMLDDIQDVESIQAPMPNQGVATAGEEGLGLLDELSEDGRPMEPEVQEEPPTLIRGKSIPLEEAQEPSGLSDSELEEAWDVFNDREQE